LFYSLTLLIMLLRLQVRTRNSRLLGPPLVLMLICQWQDHFGPQNSDHLSVRNVLSYFLFYSLTLLIMLLRLQVRTRNSRLLNVIPSHQTTYCWLHGNNAVADGCCSGGHLGPRIMHHYHVAEGLVEQKHIKETTDGEPPPTPKK